MINLVIFRLNKIEETMATDTRMTRTITRNKFLIFFFVFIQILYNETFYRAKYFYLQPKLFVS